MPEKMSVDKRASLTALGARLEIVPDAPLVDPDNFQQVARRLAAERGWFLADQFCNPANPLAHEQTTGPEILEQCGGRVGAFVAGAGTGGTITGVGRFLRRACPAARIVLADPVGSGLADWVESGVAGPDTGYLIEGIGAGEPPAVMDRSVIDAAERIPDAESFAILSVWCARRGCSSAARPAPPWLPHSVWRARAVWTGLSSHCCPIAGIATSQPHGCARCRGSILEIEDAIGWKARIAAARECPDAGGMRRIAQSCMFLLVALLCVPAAGQAANQASFSSSSESQVLELLNEIRQEHGLSGLAGSAALRGAAREHSADMLQRDYFAHDSRNESFDKRIRRHLASSLVGENIAWGSGSYGTPAGIVKMWMHSPPHRHIILMPALHRVGLGVATGTFHGDPGTVMATADFSS